MRRITKIIVHCTDTPTEAKVSSIMKYWQDVKGWDMPGYHFIITGKGECIQLADIEYIVNGAKGFNANSIHIGYIGKRPNDIQLKILKEEIDYWVNYFKKIDVMGHRDLPGVKKTCPNFDVSKWYYGGMYE